MGEVARSWMENYRARGANREASSLLQENKRLLRNMGGKQSCWRRRRRSQGDRKLEEQNGNQIQCLMLQRVRGGRAQWSLELRIEVSLLTRTRAAPLGW